MYCRSLATRLANKQYLRHSSWNASKVTRYIFFVIHLLFWFSHVLQYSLPMYSKQVLDLPAPVSHLLFLANKTQFHLNTVSSPDYISK